MTKIRGLAEVVLWVHDLQASLAFYRDLLGLESINPPERANPMFLKAGDAAVVIPQLVVLVQMPPDAPAFQPPRTLHHLALEVAAEDFDGEVERLKSLGYSPRFGEHPVLPSRTMYIDDPDGNEVELISGAR